MIALIQFHSNAQSILSTDLAKRGPGTCPDAANTESHSGSFVQFQIIPNRIKMFILETHNGNARCPGNLDGLSIIFFGNIGDPSKQIGGDNTAGNMGSYRIGFIVTLQYRAFFT